MTPFRNEPLTDFSGDARTAQADAIERFEAVAAPLVVDGRRLTARESIRSTSPIDPKILVGRAGKASSAQAKKAVEAAHSAFARWSRVPAEERAEILLRAAAGLRARRFELNATMILEVGKTWIEADADTAEAIDFCEYYAREALRYAQDQPVTPVRGERNRLRYVPMGAVVSISPWNFPCAILAGMAAGPLAAGNPVIMKPASVSPIIGWKVFEVFEAAGVPPGVLQYLPCSGGEVGDLLVDHPLARVVSFTGSKEVGTRIHERAAKVAKGQRWLKRTVIEMGGKDAIVVDEDADLEAAAAGIAASAFGFQGQKCSACSRAIVVGKAYSRVLDRVRALADGLNVGDPRDPAVQMGPVVDEGQRRKVEDYIRIGRREGRVVAGGTRRPGPGYLLAPTVIADVPPRARVAQEEIFGPVVAFIKAKDFADAMRIANDTEYGLTGAYYGTRTAEAAETFHVGNLYLNRKCTGALVGGHPFGGFKMSGTNSKAGGPDYLRLFLESKSVAEKL